MKKLALSLALVASVALVSCKDTAKEAEVDAVEAQVDAVETQVENEVENVEAQAEVIKAEAEAEGEAAVEAIEEAPAAN